jgi:integrase
MAGRAAFGQVRKLPSGRFHARYAVPGSARGSYINAPATFPLKSAAQRWLAKQQTLIDEGKINPSAVNTTFGEFGQVWLEQRDLKASTRTLYRRQFVKALEPAWGHVRLVDITPARVGEWYATLLPDRRTERAHVYALFRTILNTAWRQSLIDSNPCRVEGAGSVGRRTKNIRPASLAELGALTSAVAIEYRPMILLGAWCALRFGEATELRRADLDLDAGVVRVRRGVTWLTGAPIVDTPKTEAGARDVAIPPHLLPILRRHLSEQVGLSPDALLFPDDRDDRLQLSPHRFRAPFGRAKLAAGRPDLTFHALRHTGAVLAAASGATIAELMARLGHTTPAMAMRYQHAAADRDRVIADALSRLANASSR